MGDEAIRTQGLRKRYGELEAVRGIDLCVPAGEIFSLPGPNGAGKSTTISMLAYAAGFFALALWRFRFEGQVPDVHFFSMYARIRSRITIY